MPTCTVPPGESSVVIPAAAGPDLVSLVTGIVHQCMSQYFGSAPKQEDFGSAVSRISEEQQVQTALLRDVQKSAGMFAQSNPGIGPFGLQSSVDVPSAMSSYVPAACPCLACPAAPVGVAAVSSPPVGVSPPPRVPPHQFCK